MADQEIGSILRDEKGRFSSATPAEEPQEVAAVVNEGAAAPVEAVAPTPVEKTPEAPASVAAPVVAPAAVSASETAYKKAMQEEREKRQRLEAELKTFREKAQPQKDPWTDLPGYLNSHKQELAEQLFVERCNLTEEMATAKYADYPGVRDAFIEAAESNPNLYAQLRQQRNPAEFVYREGMKIRELKEVNGDIGAYRSKIEKAIEARVRAEFAAKGPGAPLPASLNSDASPASVVAYQGPPPLNEILAHKH